MVKGTILWFSPEKRYGFILSENEEQIFVHKNHLPLDYSPSENDEVKFDVMEGDRGKYAVNVKLVND